MTLCTKVLLFLYVLCGIWWYWRDVLVLRRISWNQLIEKQWTVQFWSYDLISEVSTNDVLIFGFVTLPRRFRLGIVFGGEVWRSVTWRYWILLTCARQFSLWTSCLFIVLFSFACWSILDGWSSRDVERWRSDVYLVALALVCSSLESSGSLHMCVWHAIGSCIF